ncbi:unnamed protein product [Arctia plantaginis]|uniref:Uncharacterized protein n=1 Tax=Arctia plantaginis TaxID=874455 RepID=A0A8S0YN45_ARCPL|nr:unnamed protein product [Arctia plantaginis]
MDIYLVAQHLKETQQALESQEIEKEDKAKSSWIFNLPNILKKPNKHWNLKKFKRNHLECLSCKTSLRNSALESQDIEKEDKAKSSWIFNLPSILKKPNKH